MTKNLPLWHRIYFDECYTEIARVIGYAGCTYREMIERLEPIENRFGKGRAQQASYHLVTFEGQNRTNVDPLAKVELRAEVRKLCWQLLGPPPEHPEYSLFKSNEPWIPPWNRPAALETTPEQPKPKRKKA